MKKRGISDIIVVVLLVSFVIVLSLGVATFTRKTTEDITTKTDVLDSTRNFCEEVSFIVKDVYCDEELIYVNIENNNNVNFKDSFTLTVDTLEEEREITTFLVNTELNAYEGKELKALRIVKEDNVIPFNKISIIPKLEINGNTQYCNDLIQEFNVEGKGCD